jgi:glutamyl-tRNA synthetase
MPDSTPVSLQTPRVRIAPSPTGDPHVGTAYIGLINYIFARQGGGQFVLRIEDTDRVRFVATSEQMIFDALHWLGLSWDEGPDVGGPYGPYRQSERSEIYQQHADLLLANGTAYRCFCTAEELEASRAQQMAAKQQPRYAGACRNLTEAEIQANLAAQKPFVIRMKIPTEGSTTFRDELRGEITFEHAQVDDQVLLKSDGYPTYHLANVVDDYLMRITDVIRAEEWISSTPKHVLLYKFFNWPAPRFWHMPLLRNSDRSKISKRKNPVSLIYYRETGYLPNAMLNFLALGGGMPADINSGTEIFSLDEMIQHFEIKNISLGGPVFDLTKLNWLNGEYIRSLTFPELAGLLQPFFDQAGLEASPEKLLAVAPLIRERIQLLSEAPAAADFFFVKELAPYDPMELIPQKGDVALARRVLQHAQEALATVTFDHDSLDQALRAAAAQLGLKAGPMFQPIRVAVCGRKDAPPLFETMAVLGRETCLDRIRQAEKSLQSLD